MVDRRQHNPAGALGNRRAGGRLPPRPRRPAGMPISTRSSGSVTVATTMPLALIHSGGWSVSTSIASSVPSAQRSSACRRSRRHVAGSTAVCSMPRRTNLDRPLRPAGLRGWFQWSGTPTCPAARERRRSRRSAAKPAEKMAAMPPCRQTVPRQAGRRPATNGRDVPTAWRLAQREVLGIPRQEDRSLEASDGIAMPWLAFGLHEVLSFRGRKGRVMHAIGRLSWDSLNGTYASRRLKKRH